MKPLALALQIVSQFPHSLIKFSGDLNLKPGSDLDLFVMNSSELVKNLTRAFQPLVNEKLRFGVRELHTFHHHFDVYESDVHLFRLDLYGKLPSYQQVLIKEGFFESTIERSSSKEFFLDGAPVILKLPHLLDEAILRYIEYQEWYANRPDKIKHVQWIESQIQGESARNEFFLRLHHFIKLPSVSVLEKPHAEPTPEPEKVSFQRRVKRKIKKVVLGG